jgi:hypothetical protein
MPVSLKDDRFVIRRASWCNSILTSTGRVFFEKLAKKFPLLWNPRVHYSVKKKPVTGLCPTPDESSPHSPKLF